MIKTINLKANEETQIDVVGGTHVKIKNLGDSTVYVSKHSGIVASADNVKSVQGNTTDILVDVATYSSKENIFDYYGTIYALAESNCSIELETTNNSNFKQIVKGGDGFTSVVSSDKFICECNQLNYVVDSYTEIVNIVAQPVDCICAVGDAVTLKVVATGNELVYQWQKQYTLGDIINKWKNIDGETSNTLSFEVKSTVFRVGMQFRCVVTDKYGNQMISNSVKLIEKEEL